MTQKNDVAQRMGMKESEIDSVKKDDGGLLVTTFEGAQTFLPAKDGDPVAIDESSQPEGPDPDAVFAEATHADEHANPDKVHVTEPDQPDAPRARKR